MQCPNCGHQNPADARFCSQCGTALAITCPVCSTVAAPGDKFCSNCGSVLDVQPALDEPRDDLTRYLPKELLSKLRSAEAGHSMRGERRTVTILFADIKGSTSAAERLDPEDWATIVNGAFEHLIAPVYRFEGTLAHLQGDGLHAIFGAPIAHEDDPVRAIRAGLAILDAVRGYSQDVMSRWGFPLEVRVGVNTGLVVVGEVGSDLRVEYTALGDAINVAARMEQTAQPGTVQVTARTLSLTDGMFEAEALGPIELKGKADPVEAYRILRFVGTVDGGAEGPVVGRADELSTLDDMRSRLATGSGWIASLIGDAGVGKSRLVTEFRRRSTNDVSIADRFSEEGDVFWLSGQGRSYDRTNPYALMRELLRRWLGEAQGEPTFDTVTKALENAGFDDPDGAALIGFIAGIELADEAERFVSALETPVLQARATETFVAFISALAGRRPGVIVLEDLHWADDLSLALSEEIMEQTERMPIGLLLTMRPYREDPSWRIHEVANRDHPHRYQHLDLASLTESESEELITSLLHETSISTDIRSRILQRSDGNPLFIEQMVSSLAETATGDAAVPDSLTGILTARLDRLDEESRFMVQMASVLGSEFRRETLAALYGRDDANLLVNLFRRGILVDHDSGRIGFHHALIQETAYSTILLKSRRELHQRVADYLIEQRPDEVQEIARHLTEADVEAAFPYLIEAGTQASRTMALADAIRLFTTAIENIPVDADPQMVERAHSGLGEAYSLVPDLTQAAVSYQQLYEYGERENRPSMRVAALNNLGYTTAAIAFDLDGASRYLDEARELAEQTGDELGLAQYHMNACFVASMAGRIDKAVLHDEETVALGEKTGTESIRLSGLVRRATNYAILLDQEKGVPSLEAALQAAEEAQREDHVADLRATGVFFFLAKGDLNGAKSEAEAVQPTLERYRSFFAGMNRSHIGLIKASMGDLEGALTELVEARRIATRLGQVHAASSATAVMAETYAAIGMPDPIEELRAESLGFLAMPAGDFLASTVWAELAFANLRVGALHEAVVDFTTGLKSASTAQYLERGRLHSGRALALTALGDVDGAMEDVAKAREAADERSFRLWDALIDFAEGTALAQGGDADSADEKLAVAESTATTTGQMLLAAEIHQARASLAEKQGWSDAAENHSRLSRERLEEMAATFSDQVLLDAFRAKWLTEAHVGG